MSFGNGRSSRQVGNVERQGSGKFMKKYWVEKSERKLGRRMFR
jgi:hypothetical protein